MLAQHISRNAFDIRLKKASFEEFVDGIPDFDWLHLQELTGAVALATNTRLALGRELSPSASGFTFTGDDPDGGWTVVGEVGADPEVSEVGSGQAHGGVGTGACNFFATATAFQPGINKEMLEVGKTYIATVITSNVITGSLLHGDLNGAKQTINASGPSIFQFTAVSSRYAVQANAPAAKNVTIDSISLKQIDIAASSAFPNPGDNPMDLTNNGMAIGQPGAGNVPYIYLGDGATTGLIYDTIAEWNSKLNINKLTMAVVVRVDDWGVGTGVIWRLAVDGNTELVLERRASELAWRYNVEGNFDEVTFDTATLPGGSPSEPFTMVMTVDTDGPGEIIGYMKGVARGTSTITGSWVDNLDAAECAVFAADNAQLNSLDGGGAHIGLGYRVMTPFEVVEFNTRSGL